MKQRAKIGLRAAAGMAVLGIILCVIPLGLVGFDLTRLSVPATGEQEELVRSFSPEGVDRVVINISFSNVTLLPSPDGQFHLRCYCGGSVTYDAAVNGSELQIRQTLASSRRLPAWFQFNPDWNRSQDLSLSIPDGFTGDLLLELGAGHVVLDSGLSLDGALDARLGAGNFSAESLTARSITVQCGAGNVTGRNWQIDRYAALNADAGDIRLSQVSVPDVVWDTDAGSIAFDGLTAGHIEASSGMGSISGTIRGTESDYTIDAKTGLGSCNLTSRQGTTDQTLRLSCGAGNIQIEFLT